MVWAALEKRLHSLGITTFEQIANWTETDIDEIEPKLNTVPGRIRREGWVEHAALALKDREAPRAFRKAAGT